VDYQDSLYVRDQGSITKGPDYPWCPIYHYIFQKIGVVVNFRKLANSPQGGGCGTSEYYDVFPGGGTFRMELYMDYGAGRGAAVGYLLGMLDDYEIRTTKWLTNSIVPVMESEPPLSRSSEKYSYPPDKVIDDETLVVNGLVWRHRYAYAYNPYNGVGSGSLDYAYEVYVHRLDSGELLYVKGDYKPAVATDPAWIAARRKVLRDMVGFIRVTSAAGWKNQTLEGGAGGKPDTVK
jgi:hypothetical protein